MSGVSLTMAPRTDPDDDQTIIPSKPHHHHHQQPPVLGAGVMGSLRVIELQLVAFIMVFSLSGLVPLFDLIFPAFTSAYLLILSRFAFPAHGGTTSTSTSQEIFHGGRFFRLYVVMGTVIGLFLPLAYVLGGFARGDEHALRSATPHLFLLSFQILTENIISGFGLFSPPVRALVPLLYTVRRIFVIMDWIQDVWVYKPLPPANNNNAQLQDVGWFWFGRCLAVANLMYFSINLLGFLIPRFLPRAFEKYYKETDIDHAIHADVADDQDKISSTARNTSSSSSHPINPEASSTTAGTKKSD